MEEEKLDVVAEFSTLFLTESEVAQFLHLSVRTLRTWRFRGSGPIWHSFGRGFQSQRTATSYLRLGRREN